MFQLQFVIGLFIGFQFNIIHKVLNAPIDAENDLEPDYNAAEARSLFGNADPSMNEADAYEENELENIFINPEELGPYLEGDIFIPGDLMFPNDPQTTEKIPQLWPNGVVPVTISPNFTKPEIKMIRLALSELTSKTCLRFPTRTTEADYVHFSEIGYSCSSYVGRQGGEQIINLQRPICFKTLGKIHHEILHALGFLHEHTRNDRDDYVKIVWDNIKTGQEGAFTKSIYKIQPSIDFTYDYASILHFSRYGFAKVKTKATIIPLFNTTDALRMGQQIAMTPMDLKKVNGKYCYTTEQNQTGGLELISFQFTSGNISLDLKYNATDINNE